MRTEQRAGVLPRSPFTWFGEQGGPDIHLTYPTREMCVWNPKNREEDGGRKERLKRNVLPVRAAPQHTLRVSTNRKLFGVSRQWERGQTRGVWSCLPRPPNGNNRKGDSGCTRQTVLGGYVTLLSDCITLATCNIASQVTRNGDTGTGPVADIS